MAKVGDHSWMAPSTMAEWPPQPWLNGPLNHGWMTLNHGWMAPSTMAEWPPQPWLNGPLNHGWMAPSTMAEWPPQPSAEWPLQIPHCQWVFYPSTTPHIHLTIIHTSPNLADFQRSWKFVRLWIAFVFNLHRLPLSIGHTMSKDFHRVTGRRGSARLNRWPGRTSIPGVVATELTLWEKTSNSSRPQCRRRSRALPCWSNNYSNRFQLRSNSAQIYSLERPCMHWRWFLISALLKSLRKYISLNDF